MTREEMIKKAVDAQAMDDALWTIPLLGTQPIAEAYLQEALRDLHRVIEEGDERALDRIIARVEDV